jgi:hypothetical protein
MHPHLQQLAGILKPHESTPATHTHLSLGGPAGAGFLSEFPPISGRVTPAITQKYPSNPARLQVYTDQ